MAEIGVYFGWLEVRPDNRQYRQNSVLLVPQTQSESPVKVWVGVPLESQYVHNYEQIISAQLDANSTAPDPILTPKGMQLALERLGESLVDEEPPDLDDEDWVGKGKSSEEKPSKDKAEKDDDWTSDDDKTSDDPESEKWEDDEETEDWNS